MQSQHVILKNSNDNFEAVKLGFSWITLLRVWGLAGIIFFIIDRNMGSYRPEWIVIFSLQNIIGIPLGVALGAKWNAWKKRRLIKKGYRQVDVLTAANPDGAVALHIKNTNG